MTAAVDLAIDLKPDAILFENSDVLLHAEHRQLLRKLLTRMLDAGYYAGVGQANASDFGVPSSRPRCFVVAVNAAGRARDFERRRG